MRHDNSVEYYVTDHLGSVSVVTDGSGKETQRYIYGPYGNLEYAKGNSDNRYLFQGKEFDVESGDLYFGARYFDPQSGRWQARDPKEQHFSSYLAFGNNPLKYIDPDGKDIIFELVGTYTQKVNDYKGKTIVGTHDETISDINVYQTNLGDKILNRVSFGLLGKPKYLGKLTKNPDALESQNDLRDYYVGSENLALLVVHDYSTYIAGEGVTGSLTVAADGLTTYYLTGARTVKGVVMAFAPSNKKAFALFMANGLTAENLIDMMPLYSSYNVLTKSHDFGDNIENKRLMHRRLPKTSF